MLSLLCQQTPTGGRRTFTLTQFHITCIYEMVLMSEYRFYSRILNSVNTRSSSILCGGTASFKETGTLSHTWSRTMFPLVCCVPKTSVEFQEASNSADVWCADGQILVSRSRFLQNEILDRRLAGRYCKPHSNGCFESSYHRLIFWQI